MKWNVRLETTLLIIRYALSPINCWPPPVEASNLVKIRHNIFLVLGVIHMPFVVGPSMYSIYLHRHDAVRVIKIVSETTALSSAMINMIICKIEAPRLQALIATMEAFLKEAKPEEREIIQFYADKCLIINATVLVSVIFGPLLFLAGPWITSQPFPADVAYPFTTSQTWVWTLLFISLTIAIVQVGCMVILDVFFAVLIWYVGARFKILSLNVRKATNNDDISRCVQQHQELIAYVNELFITVRIIAIEVTGVALLKVTAGGFVLIGDVPLYDLAKYVFFEIASALELLLLTWPLDNLLEVSDGIAESAFACDWIGKPPAMVKNILIIIQRSRNSIKVYVNGVLPVLSLEFYGSTMAAAFSYLTTLRAMTAD